MSDKDPNVVGGYQLDASPDAWNPVKFVNGFKSGDSGIPAWTPGWRIDGDIVNVKGVVDGSTGVIGGMFHIPIEAYPQVRPFTLFVPAIAMIMSTSTYEVIRLEFAATIDDDGVDVVLGVPNRFDGSQVAGPNAGFIYMTGASYNLT